MAASPLAAALLGTTEQGGAFSPAGMIDPAIAQATPDLQLSQSLLQQGLSGAPASPLQALGRIAQTAAGTYLQRGAISDLAKAYAHTADNAALTLPEGHPLRAALQSSDPTIRMQGLQAYQKALTLLSEPSNLSPGQNRYVGSTAVAGNTGPQSEEGKLQQDIERADTRRSRRAGATPAAGAPVPLNPPRIGGNGGGIESVIGGGTGTPPSTTSPNFNDRFSPARPSGAPPTNPLQAAIDTKAQVAAATEAAKNPALIARAGGTAAAENPALIERAGATEAAKNPALVQRAGQVAAAENPALIERAGASEAAKNPALITRAGGVRQAEAGVDYGDLLQPQPAPRKGPGGTEALPTTHGTLIPPVAEQSAWPKTPKELEGTVSAWNKTKQEWNTGVQEGYRAEQRLNTIANVFKTMQTGYGAEQKAHVAALLKSVGVNLPENVLGDPAKVETAIHENYVETLQQLKATTPRFTQMEFRALSENKEHPNLQPAANLTMLSEDIAQLRQARDIPRDFQIAQAHGWRDPVSFEQAWLRQNPLHGYVDNVRKEIGPLKGMPGNEPGGKAPAAGGAAAPSAPRINSQADYDRLPKGSHYVAPDGNTYIKGQ
jgi:hypothetical protein